MGVGNRNGAPSTAGVSSNGSGWSDVDAYGHRCRPALVRLLSAIGLDVVYERASGDTLWLRRGGALVPILDLVGGYGATLFGHHHPDLVRAARRCFDEEVPFHAQGSVRPGAAHLAEALCRRVGDYVVTLTNTGTETTEAAMKHALLERPRGIFWAVRGAFHGKTLGAIQCTWSHRELYEGHGPRVRFLDPDDPADWAGAATEINDVTALLLEPIAGEGGIRPLPDDFVDWVRRTCRPAGVPVIADEIQSGMGRTGTFLASEALGIDPDYVCLSKSLGGGLAKIGALLVKRSRYVEDFSLRHTSTFAEDEYASAIAVEALRLLDRDDLMARCRKQGEFLMDGLRAVQARFPDQVKDVRGRGLMVGFELQDCSDAKSYTLRALARQDYLGYVAAAYFLHAHDIRVAPSLGDAQTLRIEPSAYVSEDALQRFIRAAEDLCALLRAEDVAGLGGHVVGLPAKPVTDYSSVARPDAHEEPRTRRRVGFLGHLLLDEHLTTIDPSYGTFDKDDLQAYFDQTAKIIEPLIFDRVHVRSKTGDEVHLSFVGLGITSRQFVRAMQERSTAWITDKIATAVRVARDAGCGVVGFGGYTSIVTAGCRRVRADGAVLTTGNALTVGMGAAALRAAARAQSIDLATSSLAVLGATGNIGSTYAALLAPDVREVVLVVRNLRSAKVAPTVAAVRAAAPGSMVRVVDDLAVLADCPLIVTASSTPAPLIHPHHVGRGPVVICDISLPSNVAEDVEQECANVRVVQGGVVRLPFDAGFAIGGVPLAPGHVFACMAETLLMGLEDRWDHPSTGPVTVASVQHAMAMAHKHGFTLADLETNGSACEYLAAASGAHHRRDVH